MKYELQYIFIHAHESKSAKIASELLNCCGGREEHFFRAMKARKQINIQKHDRKTKARYQLLFECMSQVYRGFHRNEQVCIGKQCRPIEQ